jgi:multiple sugar transport system permease protein
MARSLDRPAQPARAGEISGGQRLRRILGPDWRVAIPFVLPMIVLMAVLILFPVIDAVRLSFTSRTVTGALNNVGLQNYRDLLGDKFFKDAVKVSFLYTAYSIIFKIVVGMISALLLHNLVRGRSVLTGLVLLPWIIPTVVTALAWRSIYDPIFGGLNKILVMTHLGNVLVALHLVDRVPASWLGSPSLALPSIILVNVWKGIPFFTINLLAGLKGIDKELYEAAAVDGANAWQRFLNVTLPGLRYVLLVTTLLSTIWTFNTFDIIYLLTGGGPGGTTRPFVIFAYEKAIQGLQFGAGAAVAILMMPILGILIFFLARYMRRADQRVQETALDRFTGAYGRYLLWLGLAILAIALFLVNQDMFIKAAIMLAVITLLALAFGTISATRAEHGQRTAAGASAFLFGRLPAWIALALLLFFVLAPFYWIFITAFKSELQQTTQQGNVFWPNPWTTSQFSNLVTDHPFWIWFRNTVVVALCTTVLSVGLASLSGYALARLKFLGAQTLSVVVLLTYLVPSALLFIPLYQILSQLKLINTLGSLIVTYPTFALPYASWMLMGYFRAIPEELDQAAMLDGATRFQSFWKITMPLAKPALLAVALFTFTNAWNEFLFAFVFLSKENLKTLPVGLQGMILGDVIPWGQLMAASIIMAVPVVIIYGYAQRFLVEGLTAGSVKG